MFWGYFWIIYIISGKNKLQQQHTSHLGYNPVALSIIGTHLSVVVITLIPRSCNLMIFKAFLLADGSELTTKIQIQMYWSI